MKSYAVFIISFIGFLFVFQIVSGMFLTLTYTPNISGAGSSSANVFSSKSLSFTFLVPIIAATLSFIILKKRVEAKGTL
ncbi:hypothetical protein [Bacillus mycoides]|uniref:hypothetical protein n=1 Tax=Bacillus mycoides TaxID=1405 RepID=UPI00187A3637|nr:hypothetical protein [Bacillus mycoides]MBE7128936.1 hypothetical protein [Bacillus mycoides]